MLSNFFDFIVNIYLSGIIFGQLQCLPIQYDKVINRLSKLSVTNKLYHTITLFTNLDSFLESFDKKHPPSVPEKKQNQSYNGHNQKKSHHL